MLYIFIGIIYVFIATPIYYVICFLFTNFILFSIPLTLVSGMVLLRRNHIRSVFGMNFPVSCVVAGAATIAITFLPPHFINEAADASAHRLLENDWSSPSTTTKNSVESLTTEDRFYPAKAMRPLDQAPCRDLCQKLLSSGRLETVRVTKEFLPAGKKISADYSLEARQSCYPVIGYEPEIRQLAKTGVCIVFREASDTPMGALIRLTEYKTENATELKKHNASAEKRKAPVFGPGQRAMRQIEVTSGPGDPDRIFLRKTESTYVRVISPLHFWFEDCLERHCPFRSAAFNYRRVTLNPIDPVGDILAALNNSAATPAN